MRRFLVLLAGVSLCAAAAYSQDEPPSLGDVARQARQQKQQKDIQPKDASAKSAQNKDAQTSDANSKDAPAPKAARVITNEELPRTGLAGDSTSHPGISGSAKAPDLPPASGDQGAQAEQWKSKIQDQKSAIASLQHEIDNVTESIHYVGGNCVANCVEWNERQKQKQDEVESMKAQLAEQQKRLEEMQDSARKQGFGSSVYEP
jgi:hypothetical protein